MLPALSTTLDAALSFVKGDHFPGIAQITVSPAPANAVASARFQIRSVSTVTPRSQSFSTAAGTITIVSAANWIFTIPAAVSTLPVGKYNYQFETTDSTGIVFSPFEGVLTVAKDYAL